MNNFHYGYRRAQQKKSQRKELLERGGIPRGPYRKNPLFEEWVQQGGKRPSIKRGPYRKAQRTTAVKASKNGRRQKAEEYFYYCKTCDAITSATVGISSKEGCFRGPKNCPTPEVCADRMFGEVVELEKGRLSRQESPGNY